MSNESKLRVLHVFLIPIVLPLLLVAFILLYILFAIIGIFKAIFFSGKHVIDVFKEILEKSGENS